jgi:diguanylate cyclase (GGDEF)-like protein
MKSPPGCDRRPELVRSQVDRRRHDLAADWKYVKAVLGRQQPAPVVFAFAFLQALRVTMKLLLIEDNLDDVAVLGAALQREQASPVELTHVPSLAQARERLPGGGFDCVLLDLDLPDGTGLDCVDAIRAMNERLPMIALSGRDDEELALNVLNRGVQDYLVKWEDEARTVLRSVRYAIERKRAELRLSYLAQFDPLTEIGNRQYFQDQLQRATARARRDGSKVALFFLDIDQFKIINDTLGHQAGDQLLQEVAQRLASQVRTGDVMARLGGDEFAILMEGVGSPVDAGTIAQQLLEVIEAPFAIDGRQVQVTTSIGITFYPSDNNDTTHLLKNADIAMYQAKDSGRNNFKFFTQRMHTELLEYHELEREIAEAMRNKSFRLVFQPKVNLLTRRLEGLEALLRWDSPTRGPVSPAKFIPVAEASGHIVPLGYWVLSEVCATIARWQARGLPIVPVSVNVSTRQFQQADFQKRVAAILQEQGTSAQLIELEMTEGLLMDDTEQAHRALRRLKALGLRISIDDFGTGHSCLSYLRRFPIDVLKIDRSFVNEIGENEDSRIIIDAIISLAGSLKLETVAEGVETNAQLDYLLERGCHVAQGFLFGMPMAAEQVEPLLHELLEDTCLPTVSMPAVTSTA